MSRHPARCAACGADLPGAQAAPCAGAAGVSRERAPVGRPRRYCSQRCRQRAYRNRTDHAAPAAVPVAAVAVAAAAGAVAAGTVAAGAVAAGAVAADRVTVRRAWLADVADRVYQLDCAVEDVRTALAENATRAELVTVCRNLVDSAGSLRPALRRLSRL